MNTQQLLVSTLGIAAVAGSLALPPAHAAPTSAPPAAVCTSGVPGDVNGDGYAEVVAGDTGTDDAAPAIHVLYGTPTGLTTYARGTALDDQYLALEPPTMPISHPGTARIAAQSPLVDFNADGCADLALLVAAELEDAADEAEVVVLYGSRSGLASTGQRIATPPAPAGFTASFAPMGSLVVGDFNRDGVADLGAKSLYFNVVSEARPSFSVFYGSPSGLDKGEAPETVRPTSQYDDEDATYWGSSFAAGDFDGDGADELAMDIGEGWIETAERGATGFAGQLRHRLRKADLLGGRIALHGTAVMASADATGDGRDDLALGIENWECPKCAPGHVRGVIVLVKGTAAGLTRSGRSVVSQATAGVEGSPEATFGATLIAARLDGDRFADLAVGADSTVQGRKWAGSVTLLRGSAGGLTTAGYGGRRLTQATPGLAGTPNTADHFGFTLTANRVQGKAAANLIIGTPGETIGRISHVGRISQLSLTSAGPTTAGSVDLHPGSSGLKGGARAWLSFAESLS